MDLKLALQLSTDAELTTASYEEYATAVRELTAYKEQLGVLRQEHCSLMDLINYSAIIVGESSPLLSSLIEEYANYSSKIAKLVSYLVTDNTCFLLPNACIHVGTVNIGCK